MAAATDADAMIEILENTLQAIGEKVIIQRMTTGPDGTQIPNPVSPYATVVINAPQDIVNAGGSVDSTVTISPVEMTRRNWPQPPAVDDRIIIAGVTNDIRDVQTHRSGGRVVRYDLKVKT